MNRVNLLGNLKNLGVLGLVVGIVLMLSGSVNAYNINGNVCTCDSCEDCENALNDTSCTTVKLTADIMNHNETCINKPQNFNNKTFDCQGHAIDGNNSWISGLLVSYYAFPGIWLYEKSGNTIKNCVITDFGYGILLDFSSNNTLTNNTVNNNGHCEYHGCSLYSQCYGGGIYLSSSSNNAIINTIANNNSNGIWLDDSSNNILTHNTVNDNYHGIKLYSSSYNTIVNNTVNNNREYGIYLDWSSNNNTLANNTANSDGYKGIVLYRSSHNNLANNTANNSNTGIYLYRSSHNNLANNTANNNRYGILLGYSSNYNNLANNTANNNDRDGIWLYYSSYNTLTNNIVNNNKEYGILLSSSSNHNTINSSHACLNTNKDIYNGGSGNTGDNNKCDKTSDWDDTGTTECTYPCTLINCTPYDFDNNIVVDIFDVVSALENLSEGKTIHNTECSDVNKNGIIDLEDVLDLMDEIVKG